MFGRLFPPLNPLLSLSLNLKNASDISLFWQTWCCSGVKRNDFMTFPVGRFFSQPSALQISKMHLIFPYFWQTYCRPGVRRNASDVRSWMRILASVITCDCVYKKHTRTSALTCTAHAESFDTILNAKRTFFFTITVRHCIIPCGPIETLCTYYHI